MCEYPKVLLVSHCVISKTTNNGKTMHGFFQGWDVKKLAEIYLNPEIPDSYVCENYYRITDLEVMKSILKHNNKVGQILTKKDIACSITNNRTTTERQESIYNYARKRKPYMYVLRNFIWGFNTWNTKELNEWIDEFNPEVILYVAGSFIYSYKIALKIAQTRKIPLIVYFSDDHYITFLKTLSPIYWLNRFQFKNTVKRVINYSTDFICICDEMNKAYSQIFRKEGNTIMTAASFAKPFGTKGWDGVFRISYIGNLNFNRWKSLINIGKIIDNIQLEGVIIEFCVYSGVTDKKIINYLKSCKSIKFKGKVNYSEVLSVMDKSDLLLHVESFDKVSRVKTKYSISTKIPDSLLSGRCLFAYGPPEVASIGYLLDNEAACVVTDPEFLEARLIEIIENHNLRDYYITNALNLARKNHSFENIRKNFKDILIKASKTKGSNDENTSN
jgi:glycosyltransferase involved in cell wall biosynthesis